MNEFCFLKSFTVEFVVCLWFGGVFVFCVDGLEVKAEHLDDLERCGAVGCVVVYRSSDKLRLLAECVCVS